MFLTFAVPTFLYLNFNFFFIHHPLNQINKKSWFDIFWQTKQVKTTRTKGQSFGLVLLTHSSEPGSWTGAVWKVKILNEFIVLY